MAKPGQQTFCRVVNYIVDNCYLPFIECGIALIFHWVTVISENHCQSNLVDAPLKSTLQSIDYSGSFLIFQQTLFV